jgi:hypothetical protein
MRFIHKKLYIEFEKLTSLGIKEITISQNIQRKKWQAIKSPDDNRNTLIEYETMGTAYQAILVKAFGDVYQYAREQQNNRLAKYIVTDNTLYQQLLYKYPSDKALDFARCAAWIDFLAALGKSKTNIEGYGFTSKEEVYQCVIKGIQSEGLRTIKVTNTRYLQNLVSAYRTEEATNPSMGWQSLLNGREGNNCAAKLQEEQRKLLLHLACKPNTIAAQIKKAYNQAAEAQGWKPISTRSVELFLKENKIVWQYAALGAKRIKKSFDPVIPRQRPTKRNMLWVFDGTPIDLYYQKVKRRWNDTKEKHEERISKYERIYCMYVIDAATWKIIGYALGETETAALVKAAIKDAVRNTMTLPHQLQYDNGLGSAKALNDFFTTLETVYCTPTLPYNPKGKVIEAIIGKFQELLRSAPNWAGKNITARKENSHFNAEALKEAYIPTFEEVIKQHDDFVQLFNNLATRDRESPNELDQQLYKKEKEATRIGDTKNQAIGKKVEMLGFLDLFLEKWDGYYYTPTGIQIQIQGKKRFYQTENHAEMVIKYARQKVQVVLDPDLPEIIYLYSLKGTPLKDAKGNILTATEPELMPMALADYTKGTRTALNQKLEAKVQAWANVAETVETAKAYSLSDTKAELAIGISKTNSNAAESAFKLHRIGVKNLEQAMSQEFWD